MNTPPLLLGSAIIFWGWQTGFLPVAIAIALIIEASRLTSFRLELNSKQFSRLWRMSNFAFIIAAAYSFFINRSIEFFLIIIQWLPLVFAPIITAQIYSVANRIELDVFFYFIKNLPTADGSRGSSSVDVSYLYFITCIGAASAANVRNLWFYGGLILLAAWSLWGFRSKRFSPVLWLVIFLLSAGTGYVGSFGLVKLQSVAEKSFINWYVNNSQQDFDASRTRTAIGDIGELKLSGKIIMRVSSNSKRAIDYRLTKTSYNRYKGSTWTAFKSPMSIIGSGESGTRWRLAKGKPTVNKLGISISLNRGEGLLALPDKAIVFQGPHGPGLSKSRLGAVKIKDGPDHLDYQALLGKTNTLAGQPDKTDLLVPEEEVAAFLEIAKKLDLKSKSPGDIIKSINSFFRENFDYSLNLEENKSPATPLTNFLLDTRSGHCEYFATAATLLLRQAGIPARYTVGYVYSEFSRLEKRFIIRERNAHAWASAYLNGKWIVVDTTPSSWMEADLKHASFFEPAIDIWYSLSFLFSKWKREGGSVINNPYTISVLVLLTALILLKVWKNKKIVRKKVNKKQKNAAIITGKESPFFNIEKNLASSGFLRRPGETYHRWLRRLEEEGALPFSIEKIKSILFLHNRWRFDPTGISEKEKEILESEIALLLIRK